MAVTRPASSSSWSMFVAAHRAHSPRRRTRVGKQRLLVFAPEPGVRRWIEHELFAEPLTVEIVHALADVVTSLTLVPPPWPQFLIVDVAAISPSEVESLATIRRAGWPGMVIAIGEPSRAMQKALAIDQVVSRELGSEVLRNALKRMRAERPTIPLRKR